MIDGTLNTSKINKQFEPVLSQKGMRYSSNDKSMNVQIKTKTALEKLTEQTNDGKVNFINRIIKPDTFTEGSNEDGTKEIDRQILPKQLVSERPQTIQEAKLKSLHKIQSNFVQTSLKKSLQGFGNLIGGQQKLKRHPYDSLVDRSIKGEDISDSRNKLMDQNQSKFNQTDNKQWLS